MQPVKMTRAEYEAKYGAQVPASTSPIKMTRAEYNAKYGSQPAEQSFADKLLFNKPIQNVPEENNGSVGSFVKNFASAAYKNVADPLTNRMNEVSDRALATGQSPVNTGIQAGGALAGTALDVSFNKGTDMAVSGIKTAQDYAKGLSKYVPSSIANYKNELPIAIPAPTETEIATKTLGKAANYAFNTFPEQHPTAAGTTEAVFNILGVLPGETSLRAAGTNLAKGASRTIEATTPLTKATKQAVINKIAPGPEILNTKVDKQIVNIFKGTTADSAKVAESAFKAKKGLDLLVQNAKTLNVADINAPLGSGVTKALDIKKATPNEILSGVFEMDKKIANLGREAASNATKEGIKLDTLPAQKIIANAHNEGKLSTPATNNLMRQLEATQGDPTKIHDWIQDQVNIRYFTKAGNLEDSMLAKYANDAADSMRTNLNKVVDRAGYAEAYGNNQELKRMLVTIAKKANKKVNFGDIATDAGLDAAISVITGNPEYMARTIATGLFRGVLSGLRNQSGMKSFKKAAAMLEDIPSNARLPRTNTKIDYSLPRLPAGAIPMGPATTKGSILVTNTNADARTMNKTLRLPAPSERIITPNTQGTPNPLGRPYKAGGEPARIGGVEQRLPLKSELKVVPDTLEGITDATDFDKLSSKEKDIVTRWLNKQPDEYLTNKQQAIKGEIEVAKGTVDTMTDVYAGVLKLEKYISKSGQYKGEFRFEDGSKGKFAKGYDEILSNAFNQYSTNGKLTESEMIDKYFSIKKAIQEQKDTIKQLQTEYKKTEALQPYKRSQSSTANLPPIDQITTKAKVSGEGKMAKIPSNMNNVIKKSPDVIDSSILPKANKSSKPSLKEAIKANKGSVNIGNIIEDIKTKGYKNTGDLTTKILSSLEGKSSVSKQYILDATNRGELKQVERDLTRQVLDTMPDGNIDVNEFAKKLTNELLPLKVRDARGDIGRYKYENISLPANQRGSIKNYNEHIYESPIKTSAGDTHFSGDTKNYFGHTRIEDMADNKTRRVIEVQSDLYQKGNLEKEGMVKLTGLTPEQHTMVDKFKTIDEKNAYIKSIQGNLKDKVSKLQQYNDPTAHFRMIREEIKKAAQDGKTKLQFPTGETAMKIEGLGNRDNWLTEQANSSNIMQWERINEGDLSVGMKISQPGSSRDWIITDVLGDGKFKAVPKDYIDKYKTAEQGIQQARAEGSRLETFDISGKVDTNNPIYKFYEKDVQKYLNKFGGKQVVDDKGVTWVEIPITKEQANMPVEAFGLVGLGIIGANEVNKKVTLPKGK